jgi:SAM-dependent methyltransferase
MREHIDLHGFAGVRTSSFERTSFPYSQGWKCTEKAGEFELDLRGHRPLAKGERLVLALLKHSWSGIAEVEPEGGPVLRMDLYEQVIFQNYLVPLPEGVERVVVRPTGQAHPMAQWHEVQVMGAFITDETSFPNYFPKLLDKGADENNYTKWENDWSDACTPGNGCGGWPYREPFMGAFAHVLRATRSRSIMEIGAQSGRWLSFLMRYLDRDLTPLDWLKVYREWDSGGFKLLEPAKRAPPGYDFSMVDCTVSGLKAGTSRMPWVRPYCIRDLNTGLGDIPDKSVDVVFAFQTVEHIHNTEHLLKELCRVARKYVICSTPFEENPHPLHPVRLDEHRMRHFFHRELGLTAVSFADDYSSDNIRKVAPNSRFWCVRLEAGLPDPLALLDSRVLVPEVAAGLLTSSVRGALNAGRRLLSR